MRHALAGDGRAPELARAVLELLETGSTRRYWPYVLERDPSAVNVFNTSGVPSTSWIWRRIAVDASTGSLAAALLEDPEHGGDGLDVVLDRLAGHDATREQERLLNLAIERWGSPLGDDWQGRGPESARRLAAAWAARRAIVAFFSRPDEDDPRRAVFWSHYSEAVDELWVFFGRRSAGNDSPDLNTIRSLLGRRAGTLDDDEADALVLTIRGWVFVEMNLIGSDLYIHPRNELPFTLDSRPQAPTAMRKMGDSSYCRWHTGAWERRVDEAIVALTGVDARSAES